jgi:acetyl esterase/lipase
LLKIKYLQQLLKKVTIMQHLPAWMKFILVVFVFALASCSKETSNESTGPNPTVALVIKNEKYGSAARNVADIHLPANRSTAKTKMIVIMHGGSWTQGDKADLDLIIEQIKNLYPELAIVNMNYRLADGTAANYHPSQMNDIKQLLDYIETKKTIWQVGSPTGIAGVSAGAHLAMLYAYAFDTDKKMKCVVNVVGPTDFSDPLYSSNPIFQLVAANFLGKTWAQDPDLHRSVSPALRVTTTSAPTFMAYGTIDNVVPISNAFTLRQRLITNGVTHTYVEYPTEGHEFSTTAISDLLPRVVTFLKANL